MTWTLPLPEAFPELAVRKRGSGADSYTESPLIVRDAPGVSQLRRWNLNGSDFAIQARVRRLLARHRMRTDCLEIGTTQGVVVLKGRLERAPGVPRREDDDWEREVRELAAAIRALPDVVDVATQLHEPERMDPPCTGTEG